MNLRSYYAEGSKTLAFEIVEQLGWETPTRGRGADRLGRDVHEGLAGLRAVRAARADRAATGRGCTAARPRAARRWRRRSPRSGACRPVRPELDRSRSIAIGNPADGDLAIATAQGIGRRRSTPFPRTRSGRTSRCSPRRPASSARARPASRSARSARRSRRGDIGESDRVVVLVTGTGLKTPQLVEGERRRRSRSTPTSTRCSTSWGSRRERGVVRRPRSARRSTRSTVELLAAVNRRLELVRALHEHKLANGMPLRDPGREDAMLRAADGGEQRPAVGRRRRRVLPLRARPDPPGDPR